MNISGQWIGTLTYGQEYGDLAGKTLRFEMELSQIENKFSGLSKDLDGVGVNPDPAEIKGKLTENEINFVKQYRSLHLADKNNSIDKSRKGPKIFYSGRYDEALKEFSGLWKMFVQRKFFGLIPINRHTSGTWEMKRK
ncbi:MAG: hypothetical protein COA32_15815 [Fluviicola sp.]|nr:MAG: hypothetical protein COA32_15815 [Fluviicola sp.]